MPPRARAIGLALCLTAFALAGGGCGPRPARVWVAASGVLPAGTKQIVYIDLAALRRSDPEGWLLERVGERLGFGEDAPGRVRAGCGIDLGSAEVLFAARGYSEGGIFVRIPGVDRERLLACLRDTLGLTAVSWNDFTYLERKDGGPVAYVAWIARDVFAVPFDRDNHQALSALIGGKGKVLDDEAVARAFVDVEDGAAMWGLVTEGRGKSSQSMAFNVHAGGDNGAAVSATAYLYVGSWVKAYLMARMLRKKTRDFADDVQAMEVVAEGERVVVRFWLSSEQAKRAAQQLLQH